MRRGNLLKQKLARGERLAGLWVQSASPTNAEIAVLAGFEVALIDNEHGPAGLETTIAMLRAVEAAGGMPIVRVPWNDQVYLKRVLDLGANSLMLPMIQTAAEAKAAVAACRYPPLGNRGYAASIARASNYGLDTTYLQHAHEDLLLILQIESKAALEAIPAIAGIDGVDMLFIGANDLAGSIDHLERLDAPPAAALIEDAEEAVRSSGAWMGTIPRAGHEPQALYAKGHRLVIGPSDLALLRDAARRARAEFDGG
ncbi:MAG: aldolase [Geminicoccaceae bacterium]|nr:MAG: aldolase [Geminicoccaceae bacterium]